MTDSRDKRADQILQLLEDLPALPEIAQRVLQTHESDDAAKQNLLASLSGDRGLITRIAQLVAKEGSASIGELTFEEICSGVLAVSVFQTLGQSKTNPLANSRFSREAFWQHSLAVGCLAEELAQPRQELLQVAPCEAFLSGLLHDLGKLALDVAMPKSYSRVVEAADLVRGDIADLERSILGIDHQIAGKRLAEKWQLPASVRDAAWLHGLPPAALPVAIRSTVVNLVTLADVVVRQQHLGFSGNHTFTVDRESLLKTLGLCDEEIELALSALVQKMELRAAALGLGRTTGPALYRQAVEQANRELTRVSNQLAAKSRRLDRRSQFFDVLEQFQQAIRPDAPPVQILSAIASAAGVSIGVDRLAAFSLTPGRDRAEVLLANLDEAVLESHWVDLPGLSQATGSRPVTDDELREIAAMERAAGDLEAPSTTRPGVNQSASTATAAEPRYPAPLPSDGPVLPAGDEIEWLTGALSPKLPPGNRFWICLQSEGACIGGVIWSAAAGESARLIPQAQELNALRHHWALALRMTQVRDESRQLTEDLAAANRRLHAAQEAVLRTRSLTTIAEMAAGAAHEMNNPLAVISGRSQLLARQVSDDKQRASAKLIYEQSDRLSDMITELMAFAKPQPPHIRRIPLDRLLAMALESAKRGAPPADREIMVEASGIPDVMADETQIAAALTEVVANAIQATRTDGKIVIRGGFDAWSGNVVLDISDDGVGMDDATLKRAFDPFFSSKPAGRRPGLGLPKALRWIEASGGSIRLQSEPGKGTRALVLIPAATDEEQRLADGMNPDGSELKPNNAPRRVVDEVPSQEDSLPPAGAKPPALRG